MANKLDLTNKRDLDVLRIEITNALKVVAEKYNLNMAGGGISYNRTGDACSVKVEVVQQEKPQAAIMGFLEYLCN